VRIIVTWDGSGHGLGALEQLVGLLRARSVERIDIVVLQWPPKATAMWLDVETRQVLVDDLHRAAAEIAAENARRLAATLAPISSSISSSIRVGEFDDVFFEVMWETKADLLLVVLGSYDPSGIIEETLHHVISKSKIPMWIVRAPRR
jgi:hypothetical protein